MRYLFLSGSGEMFFFVLGDASDVRSGVKFLSFEGESRLVFLSIDEVLFATGESPRLPALDLGDLLRSLEVDLPLDLGGGERSRFFSLGDKERFLSLDLDRGFRSLETESYLLEGLEGDLCSLEGLDISREGLDCLSFVSLIGLEFLSLESLRELDGSSLEPLRDLDVLSGESLRDLDVLSLEPLRGTDFLSLESLRFLDVLSWESLREIDFLSRESLRILDDLSLEPRREFDCLSFEFLILSLDGDPSSFFESAALSLEGETSLRFLDCLLLDGDLLSLDLRCSSLLFLFDFS